MIVYWHLAKTRTWVFGSFYRDGGDRVYHHRVTFQRSYNIISPHKKPPGRAAGCRLEIRHTKSSISCRTLPRKLGLDLRVQHMRLHAQHMITPPINTDP